MCECGQNRITQAIVHTEDRVLIFCSSHKCYELYQAMVGNYKVELKDYAWGYTYKQTDEQTKIDNRINRTQKMLETKEEKYCELCPNRNIGLSEALAYMYGSDKRRWR